MYQRLKATEVVEAETEVVEAMEAEVVEAETEVVEAMEAEVVESRSGGSRSGGSRSPYGSRSRR